MPELPRSPGDDDGPDLGPDSTERALRRALDGQAGSVDPGPPPRVDGLAAPQRRRWPAALVAAAGVAVLAVSSALVLQPGSDPEPVAAPSSRSAAPSTPGGTSSSSRPSDEPSARRSAATTAPTAEPTRAPAEPTGTPATGAAPAPTGGPVDGTTAAPRTATTTDEAATTTPTTAPDPVTAGAIVWFVREDAGGPGLVPERTPARTGGGTEARVAAAVDHLLSSSPADPEHFNGWWYQGQTGGEQVLSVDVGDDGTTLDLPAAAFDGSVGSAYANLALAALVRTAVSNGATSPVTVLVDGRPGAEVWGVIALDRPLEPDSRSLAGGWVLDPYDGQRVAAGRLTVSGTGTASGADLLWEVTDGSGAVVADGATQAGAEGRYASFTFSVDLSPGSYVVAVRDPGVGRPDERPGPGWQDTTTIAVVE